MSRRLRFKLLSCSSPNRGANLTRVLMWQLKPLNWRTKALSRLSHDPDRIRIQRTAIRIAAICYSSLFNSIDLFHDRFQREV